MLTQRPLLLSAATLVACSAFWSLAKAATPTAQPRSQRYEVTITNVTRSQIFAPTIVASHDASTGLFELGAPASPQLAHLAEEGDPSLLASLLSMDPGVLDVRTSAGMLMPGQSTTVTVLGDVGHPLLSVAGMLVSTNDGFFALRDVLAPDDSASHLARVYDAGSEANSEDCAYIPGPPCGSAGSHDPSPAEGFVRIHEGIHGIGGLAPEQFDWRGEAAEVRIRRVGS